MRKEYDFSIGKLGAIIPSDHNKTRIAIRIDTDILNWFRQRVRNAGGGNYQIMINEALKDYIDHYNTQHHRPVNLPVCSHERRRRHDGNPLVRHHVEKILIAGNNEIGLPLHGWALGHPPAVLARINDH